MSLVPWYELTADGLSEGDVLKIYDAGGSHIADATVGPRILNGGEVHKFAIKQEGEA